MRLTIEEKAMLAGEMGAARKWALEHQMQVGQMFDAPDMVEISQAHMMADPESIGAAGVACSSVATAVPAADGLLLVGDGASRSLPRFARDELARVL